MVIKIGCGGALYGIIVTVDDGFEKREMTFANADTWGEPWEFSVASGNFDLSFSFVPMNIKQIVEDEFAQNSSASWKEKLGMKVMGGILSLTEKMMRVNCKYHMKNVSDGTYIEIDQGVYDCNRFDFLEVWLPMFYSFPMPVLKMGNGDYALADAWGENRKDFLKFMRKMAILNPLSYPFQMARLRRLTKDCKILRGMRKFYRLPLEKRLKMLETDTELKF